MEIMEIIALNIVVNILYPTKLQEKNNIFLKGCSQLEKWHRWA